MNSFCLVINLPFGPLVFLFVFAIEIVDPWSCFYWTLKLLTHGLVFIDH